MSQRQQPPYSKPFSIAVIGGGIGGLCLALGLIRRGVPVQVYEQASEFGEIGQGVAFGPNSSRAMKLVDPAIQEAFIRLATHAAEEESEGIGRTWINFRYGGDNTDMIAKIQTFDSNLTGLSSVHRARFMEELVKLVPDGVANFNKRFVGMKRLESGEIEVSFADESTATADAIIGCDGIRSRVRQALLNRRSAEDDLSFSGTVAYRAIIPMEKAKEALGEGFAVNAQMFLAPGGHVLCYPIDHGKTVNVIASVNKGEAWDHDGWVIKDAKYDDMKRDFVGWCDEVQNIISVSILIIVIRNLLTRSFLDDQGPHSRQVGTVRYSATSNILQGKHRSSRRLRSRHVTSSRIGSRSSRRGCTHHGRSAGRCQHQDGSRYPARIQSL